MYGFLLGSAYGVSAGLIVYGIERDFIAEENAQAFILGWAVVGLLIAIVAVIRHSSDR